MKTKVSKFSFVLFSALLAGGALVGCGGGGGDGGAAIEEIKVTKYTENYKEGATFTSSGLTVVAVYKDGTEETIRTKDLTLPKDKLTANDKEATISYTLDDKTYTVKVPINVYAISALKATGFPEDPDQPATVTYATIFANVKVEAEYGPIKEEVTTYDIYDNDVKVADKAGLAGSGSHAIKLGLGEFKSAVLYTFQTVQIQRIDVEGDINSIYLDTTTWQDIYNAMTVYAVYSETNKEVMREFELRDGDTLVEDLEQTLSVGSHTVTVSVPAFSATKQFSFEVKAASSALVVECENVLTAAPEDHNPYVMVKTSYEGDYVNAGTSNSQPWCVESSSGSSGGRSIGGTAAGYVMEIHFYCEEDGQAIPQIRAASCWLKEDDGNWGPRWMGDIVLAELFTAEVNGQPFEIPANKVLKGSGSKGNTQANVATWYSWNTAEFGTIDVQEGWNTFTIKFKTRDELGQLPVDSDTGYTKYLNCHNSYTLMNIDCFNLFIA